MKLNPSDLYQVLLHRSYVCEQYQAEIAKMLDCLHEELPAEQWNSVNQVRIYYDQMITRMLGVVLDEENTQIAFKKLQKEEGPEA